MSATSDYFTLFGLTPAFAIDPAALEEAYFREQKKHHPDRYVSREDAERRQAQQRSVDINLAYEVLKNPLKRAQYLLFMQGVHVGSDEDSVKPSHTLLVENMEWREEVEAAKNAAQLSKLDESLKQMIAESLKVIDTAFAKAQWQEMAQETLRFGYLLRTQEEIAQKKYRLAS